MRRYRSHDEDSGRWAGFALRAGDVVVSARSKHGTTWVQTICLNLVHPGGLPAPLPEISPWLDWLGEPLDDVRDRLRRQMHRRVIKTHTPLDGVTLDPGVSYVVAARDPLDAAVSLYHHSRNIDRDRLSALTGNASTSTAAEAAVGEWLRRWVHSVADPATELDSLDGVLWHLADAWSRRSAEHVTLVHYADLMTDLEGEMLRLAGRLHVEVPPDLWPRLVDACTFDRMRAQPDRHVPDHGGILREPAAFFRLGGSGEGLTLLGPGALARYEERTRTALPPELWSWLHRWPDR